MESRKLKYVAYYAGKKIVVEAQTQWAAVQEARFILKVPKSKYGLLAVALVGNQDFVYA